MSYHPKGFVYDRPSPEEGFCQEGVQFSSKQYRAFMKWVPAEPLDPKDPLLPLLEAGYLRNVGRLVKHDGLRLMGLLAEEGLLEPETDPVETVLGLIEELRSLRSKASP